MYYQNSYQQPTTSANYQNSSISRPLYGPEYYSYENNLRGRSPKRNVNQRRPHKLRSTNRFRGVNNRYLQTKDGDELSVEKIKDDANNTKFFICPGCSLPYDFFLRSERYIGKIPLILNCKHTVCQECIIKSFSGDNILCCVCSNPSIVRQRNFHENPQDTFMPNFYVFGYILWSRSHNFDKLDLALAPVRSILESPPSHPQSTEKCCFLSCNKPATLTCQECSDVYCGECCTTVHKSAKSLWSHKQIPISSTKFSVALEKCVEHNNMDVEFFCVTCNCGACCYCLIEKHTGHEKDHLSKLNDNESLELIEYTKKATEIFKRLLMIRKKIENITSNSISRIQRKISECFVGLHSKLQLLERSLQKNSNNFQNIASNKSLENISVQVEKSIEELKNIFDALKGSESQKVNLKGLLKTLRVIQNAPCYLLCGNNEEEPINFVVDTVMENIEDHFKITENFVEYSLIPEDQLPEDYQDTLSKEFESDIESCITKTTKKEVRVNTLEKKKSTDIIKKSVENISTLSVQTERVDVTHIESIDCFYVQQRKMQYKLLQMNREIDNTAKLAPRIDYSILSVNDLCLAFYETKKERFWSRGRVTEIKNGENGPIYEIFFIDYGNTKTVNVANIREIPQGLAQRKPFAIQCELYNPAGVNWGKNAHIHMGKIINGKEVYMLVKKVYSGIHEVDLMVTSSDRGLTSVIDILIHTFTDSLSICSDSSKNSAATDFLDGFLQQDHIYVNDYKIFSNSVKFEKKQTVNVTIANVIDPHNIFIHIAKYADAFKKLLSSMKAYYKKKKNTNYQPVEGSFVVAEYRDQIRGNFHRALVKKVNMSNNELSVFCIDWGINITVPMNNIRMLTEEFTRLESQAIIVKLVHVEPYKKTLVWSEQSVQFLQKYFRTQDILKMVVHNAESMEVALFEKGNNVDLCINAILVHNKHAESSGKVSQIIEWPSDQFNVPNFSDDDGLVSSLLKKMDVSDSDSTDEEASKVAKQKIDVVKFVDPDLIYFKFVVTESSEELLHQELQVYYFKDRKTREEWSVGEICVVLFSNSYFRGKILSIDGDKYYINLYDKATEVECPKDHLFEYDNYFNKYPNAVFKGHLANIAPAGGEKWSMASIEATQKIFDTYQDILATKASVDTSSKSMPLKIWYAKVKIGGALEASIIKYKCINDMLVKLGYAYKKVSANIENVSAKDNASKSSSQGEAFSENCDDAELERKDESEGTNPKSWIDLVEEEEKKGSDNESPYHTREAEISDWKPAFPIKDREFNAWVTCAETEGILYIREEYLQAVYEDLQKNIKDFFVNNKQLNREKHDWQPGQLCSIESNGFWYRGKVHKVEGPDEIIAIMIDFGSDHHVKPDNLYREILYPEISAFASQIKLDRVYAKSGVWLTSDYETLLSIVPEYVKVVIKGPLNVKIPLAEVYTSDDMSLNKMLVEKCPNLTRTLIEECASVDDETVVIEEELIDCMESVPSGGINDITGISLFKAPVDTTSFIYKYESIPDQQKTEVNVMAILSYDKIVIKKTNKSLEDKLTKLANNIQPLVESQPKIDNIKLGMPCICPYSGDGLWYRAKIHNINALSCGYVIVFFVDFGNTESISIDKIRMMKPEWFNLPATCHIAILNFELKSPDHTEYVYQHVQTLFGKNKLCDIVNKNPLTIHLYDENGELNYQSLLNSGLIQLK